MLAFATGQRIRRPAVLDLLIRSERTEAQGTQSLEARLASMQSAISANPKRLERLAGVPVLLVDDVMDSGATLMASAEACLAAGATRVDVLTLARAAKDT